MIIVVVFVVGVVIAVAVADSVVAVVALEGIPHHQER